MSKFNSFYRQFENKANYIILKFKIFRLIKAITPFLILSNSIQAYSSAVTLIDSNASKVIILVESTFSKDSEDDGKGGKGGTNGEDGEDAKDAGGKGGKGGKGGTNGKNGKVNKD